MTKPAEKEKDFQTVTNEYAKHSIARMREELDDEEERERIPESCLEVQIREGWHAPGDSDRFEPTEYFVLLGTGGPASRIYGELSEYNQPQTAKYQYQDWFKPWTDAQLTEEEEKTLLEYASYFYFGE